MPSDDPPPRVRREPPPPPVDIRKLAEKVYQLMLADVRLSQARGARQERQGRR